MKPRKPDMSLGFYLGVESVVLSSAGNDMSVHLVVASTSTLPPALASVKLPGQLIRP